MTKLDILDKLDEVKIGVSYHRGGHRLDHYPSSVKQFEGVEVVSLHSCSSLIHNVLCCVVGVHHAARLEVQHCGYPEV